MTNLKVGDKVKHVGGFKATIVKLNGDVATVKRVRALRWKFAGQAQKTYTAICFVENLQPVKA